MKRSLYTIFLICVGVVLGTLLASFTSGVSWLAWLSYGLSFGLTSPFVLDLGVLSLTFGMTISINVAVIIVLPLTLFVGYKIYRPR